MSAGAGFSRERLDGVELIRLDRPPRNALSVELLDGLGRVLEALVADADLKALVITGDDQVFAAGAEISDVSHLERGPAMRSSLRHVLAAFGRIPRPVIAAISGYALGGGLEMALACDLRIASANARLGVSEILLGLPPGAGATQRLPPLVGPARAKDLIWSGRQVGSAEALAIGLVDRVVPVGTVVDEALAWAREFAGGPVVAMGLAKRAVDEGLGLPTEQGLALEAELFEVGLRTEDAAAGLRSFFESGPGKAVFRGR